MGRNNAALRALFGTPVAHVSNGSQVTGNGTRETGYGLSKTVNGKRGSDIDAREWKDLKDSRHVYRSCRKDG